MQKKRTASDAFILESLNKVISIVLKEKGFDGIQPQALESFSDLLHTCNHSLRKQLERF